MEMSTYNRAKPIVETIEKFKAIKKEIEANKSPFKISFDGTTVSNLDFSLKPVVAAMITEIDNRIAQYETELSNIK